MHDFFSRTCAHKKKQNNSFSACRVCGSSLDASTCADIGGATGVAPVPPPVRSRLERSPAPGRLRVAVWERFARCWLAVPHSDARAPAVTSARQNVRSRSCTSARSVSFTAGGYGTPYLLLTVFFIKKRFVPGSTAYDVYASTIQSAFRTVLHAGRAALARRVRTKSGF